MLIYIGSDHRGFRLKGILSTFLRGEGYEVMDVGNKVYDEEDDYPDFAAMVGSGVAEDPGQRRGILACGSGVGVDVVANKFSGVRSVLGLSPDQVYAARHDDDVNVLSLSADFILEEDAQKMVKVFLATPFGREEKYRRRLNKIAELEADGGNL